MVKFGAMQYQVSKWFVERNPNCHKLPLKINELVRLISMECGTGQVEKLALTKPQKEALIRGFYRQKFSSAPVDVTPKKSHRDTKKFYDSYDWANARYAAIRRSRGVCEACGMGKADGVKLNVDHIKPLKLHWELRADPNNLQVLCELCNKGKGNRDETDWR